jgi:A/G-specific adenine glycosylase
MRKHIQAEQFFSEKLLNWHYETNKREMPWKGEKDPYKVWLSEIILQQTRVTQGLPYYLKFIQAYPTVRHLASAKDEEVFKLWEGLGYYSRCRNLIAGARQIVEKHDGVFPKNYESILAIKGVGPYTASAIASFAFDLPHAVVDGNVTRVLSRYFGIYTPFDTGSGKKEFSELAQKLLTTKHAADYNQAIMDFGATVCMPSDPDCTACPFQQHCVASISKAEKILPVKSKKLTKKKRWFNYLVVKANDQFLIRQRQSKDIWQNLHEFYLLETAAPLEWMSNEVQVAVRGFTQSPIQLSIQSRIYTQQLTHQTINATFFEVETVVLFAALEDYKWVSAFEMDKLAFPRIINSYLSTKQVLPLLLF